MPTTYPRDIVDSDSGRWGRIHRGHGLDPEMVKADLIAANVSTDTGSVDIAEVWYRFQPRVMWCDRDEIGCGLEGTWHAHWSAVHPGGAEYAFTTAYFARGGA